VVEPRKVRVEPATLEVIAAWIRDRDEFAAMIGSPVPEGWPEFEQGMSYVHGILERRPDEVAWWTQLFFDDETGNLVGSGGYKGPPVDRAVEVGYEIAPAYRRQGWATAATLVMTQRAFETGLVDVVIAHTMPEENDSTSVLRASGFEFAGDVHDPDDGLVWRWVRNR
jgi:RimJ/RimL family protein N-acetyltransferase